MAPGALGTQHSALTRHSALSTRQFVERCAVQWASIELEAEQWQAAMRGVSEQFLPLKPWSEALDRSAAVTLLAQAVGLLTARAI